MIICSLYHVNAAFWVATIHHHLKCGLVCFLSSSIVESGVWQNEGMSKANSGGTLH